MKSNQNYVYACNYSYNSSSIGIRYWLWGFFVITTGSYHSMDRIRFRIPGLGVFFLQNNDRPPLHPPPNYGLQVPINHVFIYVLGDVPCEDIIPSVEEVSNNLLIEGTFGK